MSPDGQTIVYRAVENGTERLYRRSLDEVEATPIAGANAITSYTSSSPFFSPDGQWLAFKSGAALMKIASLGGGRPIRITDVDGEVRGADFGRGRHHHPRRSCGRPAPCSSGRRTGGGRGRTGRRARVLVSADPSRRPRRVLFTASALTVDAGDVMLLDLTNKTSRTIIRRAVASQLHPDRPSGVPAEGDLWAVRFDIDRLETVGDAVPVEQGIRVEGGGAIQFAVAGDGSLFYIPSDTRAFTLVWVDRQGRETPIGVPPRTYGAPRISPDGSKLVVVGRARSRSLAC